MGVQSLSREDPLEEGCILIWRIPWTEEPGRLQFTGSPRVRHDRGPEQTPLSQYAEPWPGCTWSQSGTLRWAGQEHHGASKGAVC